MRCHRKMTEWECTVCFQHSTGIEIQKGASAYKGDGTGMSDADEKRNWKIMKVPHSTTGSNPYLSDLRRCVSKMETA